MSQQQQRTTTLVNKGDYVPGVEDISHKAAQRMDEQAQRTDSKAVHHTADLMKAQNELMVEKDLAERFRRISALLKKVKSRSPRDYDVMQKQTNSLKPLLRLSIESSEFRSTITKLIKVMEVVFAQGGGSSGGRGLGGLKKRRSSKKSPRHHKDHSDKTHTHGSSNFVEQTVYVNQPIGLGGETIMPMGVNTGLTTGHHTGMPMTTGMTGVPMGTPVMVDGMGTHHNHGHGESWIPADAANLPSPVHLQGLSTGLGEGGMAGQMGIGGVGQQVWGTEGHHNTGMVGQTYTSTTVTDQTYATGHHTGVPMTTGMTGLTTGHHTGMPMTTGMTGLTTGMTGLTTGHHTTGMTGLSTGMPGTHPLTDEEWRQIEDGLDEFFTAINGNPQYRKGVSNMFDLISTFSAEIPNARDTSVVNELKMETRDLIAQFAGEDVLQRLFDNMEDLAGMLDDNEEAQIWWGEFVTHFRKLCKRYGGRSDLRTFRTFFDSADRIFYDERKKIEKCLYLANDVFDNLKNDEYVTSIKKKMSVLADDLYYTDNNGQKHFDLSAVRDIAGAVTDVLKAELRNIDIPDVEGSDKRGTYAIRNLHVKTKFPAKIKFRLDSELVDHTSRKSGMTAYRMNFVLRVGIQQVESWAKNINFAFHMKGIKDAGVMDVHVPTASLFIDFILRPHKNTGVLHDQTSLADPKTGAYKFVAVQSYFRIPDLVINWHKETMSHPHLVPLASKMYKRTLIKNLETAVERNINQKAESMGGQLASTMSRSPMPISFGSGEKHAKYEEHTKKRTTSGSKHGLGHGHKTEETTVKKQTF